MPTRKTWLPALTCLSLFGTTVVAACGDSTPNQPVNAERKRQGIHFKTDAATVLQALAHKAQAGIVISDDVKGMVIVELDNATVEDAMKIVMAQIKGAYRRIGNVFVVAPVESMKKVLEQYLAGQEERVALRNVPAATAVTQLTEAVPFVTARAAGRAVLLLGAPEDLTRARALLAEIDTAPAAGDPVDSAAISLTYVPAADIQKVITQSFTTLKAQAVGETSISLTGPRGDLERARQLIAQLDKGKEANARWVVYQVKYASPFALTQSLRQTVKNLTAVTGPESYYIPPAQLQLLSAQSLSGGGSGSGSGSSGGSGGLGGSGSSGSSGGGGGIGGGGQSGSSGGGGFSGGNQGGGGQGGGQGGSGERSRAIIIGGTEDAVKSALKLLESLDVPTPQVVLDVKVVSTSPQASSSLGIDWSNGSQGQAAGVSTTFTEGATNGGGTPAFIDPRGGLAAFGRLPISFTAALNAFLRRDDVKIMAKPTITALDNEPGVVFVGETRRVSVASIPGGIGSNQAIVLNSVVEIPVGIILQMRPRINEGDIITLHVHPIYSTVSGVDARTGLFNTAQREANTTVRVRSGETIVIGGLLQEEDTKTLIKIPILGDIPLIGQFFRNTSRTQLRREVLVFVTPHLVKD